MKLSSTSLAESGDGPLPNSNGNKPILFGDELDNDWVDITQVNGVNQSSPVPFAPPYPEVILSRNMEMVFGAWKIPLDSFMRPAAIISHMGSLGYFNDWVMPFNFSNLDAFVNMGFMKVISQNGTKYYGIFTIFDRAACLIASDPRDKIYGLLGLLNTPGFTADYNLSTNKALQNFALWCLGWRGKLDVLSRAGLSESESDLASWAPNLDRTTIYLRFVTTHSLKPLEKFPYRVAKGLLPAPCGL